MYIESVPNRSSPPAILLRESYREAGKVKKRTLANLSSWSPALIEGLRTLLKGGTAVRRLDDAFDIVRSLPHGHVAAVLGTLRKIGLETLIDPKPSSRRNQVLAHDRGPHPRTGLEACHGKGAGRGHGGEHPWRDPRSRARRGRPLHRHGLAPGAPGEDRAGSGEAASRGGLPGPLRPDLGVDGGQVLSPGQTRSFQGWQTRQAADRVRPVV